MLPNPLLSSAQRTHHSVLDALSGGLVVPLHVVHEVVRAFELPLASSVPNSVLLRFQLLQSLALVVVAGEGDIEPGIDGIVFVVCPI